jgi:LPS export ABC transporter protein LptC
MIVGFSNGNMIENSSVNMNFRSSILAFIFTAYIFASCESRTDIIPTADFLAYPTVTVRQSQTVFTDSGKIELILSFPIMEQYDDKDAPYFEFRSGIRVDFYDKDTLPQGSVTAKYAKYTENNSTWELKDSVVVINENNDKLETELLNWDQKKDFIFTDRFVKITAKDLIMQGFGFESDSHLNNRKIKKVSAEIYVDEEE